MCMLFQYDFLNDYHLITEVYFQALSFSTDLHICLCQYHTLLITVTLESILKSSSISNVVLSQNCFFNYHVNLKVSFYISIKMYAEILSEISLNLLINLGKVDILKILGFKPTKRFHCYYSFFIYWFSVYRLAYILLIFP